MNNKISKFNNTADASKLPQSAGSAKPSTTPSQSPSITPKGLGVARSKDSVAQNLTSSTKTTSSSSSSLAAESTKISKSATNSQSCLHEMAVKGSIAQSNVEFSESNVNKNHVVAKIAQQASTHSQSHLELRDPEARAEIKSSKTSNSTSSSVANLNLDLSLISNKNFNNSKSERIPSLTDLHLVNMIQNKSSSSVTLSQNTDYLIASNDTDMAMSSNLSSMVLECRELVSSTSGATSPTSSEFSTTSSATTSDNVVVVRKNIIFCLKTSMLAYQFCILRFVREKI
jgi:epidermal growth factor receptor substrate 15